MRTLTGVDRIRAKVREEWAAEGARVKRALATVAAELAEEFQGRTSSALRVMWSSADEIAAEIGCPVDMVTGYCKRNGLDLKAVRS